MLKQLLQYKCATQQKFNSIVKANSIKNYYEKEFAYS
jgi:hypothetical protein